MFTSHRHSGCFGIQNVYFVDIVHTEHFYLNGHFEISFVTSFCNTPFLLSLLANFILYHKSSLLGNTIYAKHPQY